MSNGIYPWSSATLIFRNVNKEPKCVLKLDFLMLVCVWLSHTKWASYHLCHGTFWWDDLLCVILTVHRYKYVPLVWKKNSLLWCCLLSAKAAYSTCLVWHEWGLNARSVTLEVIAPNMSPPDERGVFIFFIVHH
jgi:hypothetical protein